MKPTLRYIISNKKIRFHFLFWIVILVYYTSTRWPYESDKSFLLEMSISTVLIHLGLAYTIIFVLVPHLLYKKKTIVFGICCLICIYIAYTLYEAVRIYYLLPNYPEVFRMRPPLIFEDRITNIFAFLGNISSLIFPAIILMVFEYYRHQKEVYRLKEQKKTSELKALKNQLNPHFLFNTLNNLYILSLEKSDEAPEVISKLSDILDYILFRCNEQFVPLANEINMLNNYIALEKLRYGKRLNISFEYNGEIGAHIAPLLLLTFLENSFKHGVNQEIREAHIKIKLSATNGNINFIIENTKPLSINGKANHQNRESIGLKNIKTQLNILYPKTHILVINDDEQNFSIILNLISK
jgi:two-component system LytT family sensor kinase